MKIKIYKATNTLNGKAYIGLTNNMKRRLKEHKNDVNSGSDYYFHRVLRKYGFDVFEWNVITESDTREDAGQIEKQMIVEHDTFGKNGYNSTTGGDFGYTSSDETNEKRSKSIKANLPSTAFRKGHIPWNKGLKSSQVPWNKGKTGVYSVERIQELSEAAKKRTFSRETRNKMSETKKGKKFTKEHKQNLSDAAKFAWIKRREHTY